ncbi:MerR family transcriptional regulator [Secundilactobacillus kimchicus]|uniref:MerR family transcriptional regulator n=1 Tax=Secundilactobacillus kimchicus JCM 15530 TaxID=1302272 RepID=A0A0R1HMY2_9LACO|nr:MerR family transcriptional regulator [Secundilactobacillus kimchicus]KRK47775.1 MerR family transcriptional regulator [Secundilactobacillus kimchicus JCM 15530]MBT9672559.1 MerR family transcriptional regulator [Secundilactobacillus kimchicus]
MENKTAYFIGEFGEQTGLTIDTLRYYEKEGLLEPQRDKNGRRQYTETDRRWCEFIKRIKATGMPLRTIKQYSELRHRGNETIDERVELLKMQRQLLETQRAEIDSHLAFLDDKVATYAEMKQNLNCGNKNA